MANVEVKCIIESVMMTLTSEEANTLRDILANIGGCPDSSRRKYAEAIAEALDGAGITGTQRRDLRNGSSIYFDDLR